MCSMNDYNITTVQKNPNSYLFFKNFIESKFIVQKRCRCHRLCQCQHGNIPDWGFTTWQSFTSGGLGFWHALWKFESKLCKTGCTVLNFEVFGFLFSWTPCLGGFGFWMFFVFFCLSSIAVGNGNVCRIAVGAVPRGVQHGASRPWLSVCFSGEVEQYDEKTGARLFFQNILCM